MIKTHTEATKVLIGLIMLTGFTVLGAAGVEELHGQVSKAGQGAVTETLLLPGRAELHPAPVHAAAPVIEPSSTPSGLQLLGGMLLILLGFALHALLIRSRDAGQSVPVHEAPPKPRKREIEIFWVDKEIYL